MAKKELERALQEPFSPEDVEWRVAQCGYGKSGKPWAKVLAYLTARAVMNRLDDVFGVGGWGVRYEHRDKAVMCTLRVRVGQDWISKSDGAEETHIEAVKGGISSALKRAAVTLGIGRYLYQLDETWAECQQDRPAERGDWKQAKGKDGRTLYWRPPSLPKWALPRPAGKMRSGDNREWTYRRLHALAKQLYSWSHDDVRQFLCDGTEYTSTKQVPIDELQKVIDLWEVELEKGSSSTSSKRAGKVTEESLGDQAAKIF